MERHPSTRFCGNFLDRCFLRRRLSLCHYSDRTACRTDCRGYGCVLFACIQTARSRKRWMVADHVGFSHWRACDYPTRISWLSGLFIELITQGPAIVVALVAFVVIFGTILAFGLYMVGLTPSGDGNGIAASFEPIVASVAAYVFLGVRLDPVQYLGGALILVAVVLIASRPSDQNIKISRDRAARKASQLNPISSTPGPEPQELSSQSNLWPSCTGRQHPRSLSRGSKPGCTVGTRR